MAYHIKWSPRAASHFEGICDYIAKDSKYYSALSAHSIIEISGGVYFGIFSCAT